MLRALAWKSVVGVLAVNVLWMLSGHVFMAAQSIRDFQTLQYSPGIELLLFIDVLPFPAVLPILLAAMFVRRELRRPGVSIPPYAPAWMSRGALLVVLFAVVASLPIAIRNFHPYAIVFDSVSYGELVVVLALALLTRSRIWRAVALVTLAVVLATGVKGLAFFLFNAPWEEWPAGWSQPMSQPDALALNVGAQLLGLFCCAMGLMALLLPSARSAFGLPPRTGRGTKPAVAPAHA